MTKKHTILSLSDIHLGHKRTSTQFIISNLNKYISNSNTLCNIDLLIFAGDVFDSQLSLSSPDVGLIDLWIAKLLTLCKKHNVIVRVLEGTPSHDRLQPERFTIINDIFNLNTSFNLDIKRIKEVCVEHISKLGINILYVPDEWKTTTQETLADCRKALSDANIKQVDYAVMHGTFEHQLPAHVENIPRHDLQAYSELVKYLIFIGHIHEHSIVGKAVAHGSFDRLGHGEPNPKGYVIANREKDDTVNVEFKVNLDAKQYITIDTFEDDIDLAISRISKIIYALEPQSFIRLRCSKNSPIANSLNLFRVKWPLYIWSIIIENKDKEDSVVLIDKINNYSPVIIKKENIVQLLSDELIKKSIDQQMLDLCIYNLSEVI